MAKAAEGAQWYVPRWHGPSANACQKAMDQLLDKDRAELNNEIAGDALVMIEAEWRILVGSIFAAHETPWIEPVGVRKYRRIAVSLTDACPQKPALWYSPTVECDVFDHPPHHGLSLIDAKRLKHTCHREIYRVWRRAFFRADFGDDGRIVRKVFHDPVEEAVQVIAPHFDHVDQVADDVFID